MKRLLAVLTTATLLASCNTGSNDAEKTEAKTVTLAEEGTTPCDGGNIENLLIPLEQANNMIQAYHDSIHLGQNPNQNVAFELDANSLRCALVDNPQISKLDVYLALGADNKMTLVYVGAYDSAGITVEQPYTKPDGSLWMMDQVMPCPTCDRIKVHNYQPH